MNDPGGTNVTDDRDLLIPARGVLLDTLEALADHRDATIVIGAQAVYLRTGGIDVAIPEMTKDSDVALNTEVLGPDPKIEQAMRQADFELDSRHPGTWRNAEGIPVDLMVPELLAGVGRRSVWFPPHDKKSARRARGLEAAVVDYSPMPIPALAPDDHRVILANVAGPAALLVAKCHKIAERIDDKKPDRRKNKDAHDVYRILVKCQVAVG